MAYEFNGTNQWLALDTAVVTNVPMTFAAWIYLDATTLETVLSIEPNGTKAGYDLIVVSNKLWAITQDGSNVQAQGATDIGTGAWVHVAGVWYGIASRKVFRNGVEDGSNTDSKTVGTTVNRTTIGQRANGLDDQDLDGRIAEAAVWDAALSDDEIVSLAKGFNPTRVRPQNLQLPVRMIRNLQDLRAARTITNTGTATVTDHPRVY